VCSGRFSLGCCGRPSGKPRPTDRTVPQLRTPAHPRATARMVPITTTPTLRAWSQKPHSSVTPSPIVAWSIKRPIHVNDHATTAAASTVGAARTPLRVRPAIASTATVATPPKRSRSRARTEATESSPGGPCCQRERPCRTPGRTGRSRGTERSNSRRIRPYRQERGDTHTSRSPAGIRHSRTGTLAGLGHR
jgi:hypothetical protein